MSFRSTKPWKEGRSGSTIELEWRLDDGTHVSVNFYTRNDATKWWAFQVRSMVEPPEQDGDWVFYPTEFFEHTDAGDYFTTPLGSSFEGTLDLETIQIEGLRIEPLTERDIILGDLEILGARLEFAGCDGSGVGDQLTKPCR